MGEALQAATIEVIYATPDCQHVVEVPLEPGLTAEQAVARSGLLERCPEITSRPLLLGNFGACLDPRRIVGPGDRVEVCRSLQRDPREQRRELSASGRVMGRGAAAASAREC
jgi:uncharacterized protein